MYLKNALKNKNTLCSTVDKISPLMSEDTSCRKLLVKCLQLQQHTLAGQQLHLPRMVDKLQSIIDEIETQYEKLTELKAEGDTTGFTAKKFGCKTILLL